MDGLNVDLVSSKTHVILSSDEREMKGPQVAYLGGIWISSLFGPVLALFHFRENPSISLFRPLLALVYWLMPIS